MRYLLRREQSIIQEKRSLGTLSDSCRLCQLYCIMPFCELSLLISHYRTKSNKIPTIRPIITTIITTVITTIITKNRHNSNTTKTYNPHKFIPWNSKHFWSRDILNPKNRTNGNHLTDPETKENFYPPQSNKLQNTICLLNPTWEQLHAIIREEGHCRPKQQLQEATPKQTQKESLL